MLASGLFLFLLRKFNSSNIFVIVNYDNARSLNLTRLKRALGAERSLVKSFYVLYYFSSIHTCFKETDKIKERIEEVLDKVDMTSKGFKFPYELSGGEQQRIAIARALLNHPELILADEPTGNIDPQTSLEVMEVLQELNKKGHTIFMATHDYALLLKYPSKTYKCDENKVFEVVQRKS